MELKALNTEYELLEFNYHIDNSYDKPISILELLIKTDEIDLVRADLTNLFIIETDTYVYVFDGFEIQECYMVGDKLLQAVCVK